MLEHEAQDGSEGGVEESADLVGFPQIEAAARRLAPVVHRTPVVTSRRLDEQAGASIFLKCENLQKTGSFKIRGAYNTLSQLQPRQLAAGVVAYSSGNHAQAVALAARMLGADATIVMPKDSPSAKLEATRGYGAQVVEYDRYTQDRAAIAAQIAAQRGSEVIPPFDHPAVIAGQGTAALELLQEVPDLDAVLTPLGGGGLLSGTSISVRHLAPQAKIYGVEPQAGDDGVRSLRAGRIVTLPAPRTIADGAATSALGRLTFPILRSRVQDVLTATDDELAQGMRLLAGTVKLVVEPTAVLGLVGALALARTELAGRRIGVVLTGGNVDLGQYAALLAGGPTGR